MKKILLCLIFIFILISVKYMFFNHSHILKEVNFQKSSTSVNAALILRNYIFFEDKINVDIEKISAHEFDLNNDGTNEIIGIVYDKFYIGSHGYSLFILQKNEDNKYRNISNTLTPSFNLAISSQKVNGYYVLLFQNNKLQNVIEMIKAKLNHYIYIKDERIYKLIYENDGYYCKKFNECNHL